MLFKLLTEQNTKHPYTFRRRKQKFIIYTHNLISVSGNFDVENNNNSLLIPAARQLSTSFSTVPVQRHPCCFTHGVSHSCFIVFKLPPVASANSLRASSYSRCASLWGSRAVGTTIVSWKPFRVRKGRDVVSGWNFSRCFVFDVLFGFDVAAIIIEFVSAFVLLLPLLLLADKVMHHTRIFIVDNIGNKNSQSIFLITAFIICVCFSGIYLRIFDFCRFVSYFLRLLFIGAPK